MGNVGVPTLPPVTNTWHPSSWWERNGGQPTEEHPAHRVQAGDTVLVVRSDGSTTRRRVDETGELHGDPGPGHDDRRPEVIDLPTYARAS